MDPRHAKVKLVSDADHYDLLIRTELPGAKVSVWIATANLKELRIEAPIGTRARGRYVSVLDTLEGLVDRGVELRILHGRPPSGPFKQELARHTSLRDAG